VAEGPTTYLLFLVSASYGAAIGAAYCTLYDALYLAYNASSTDLLPWAPEFLLSAIGIAFSVFQVGIGCLQVLLLLSSYTVRLYKKPRKVGETRHVSKMEHYARKTLKFLFYAIYCLPLIIANLVLTNYMRLVPSYLACSIMLLLWPWVGSFYYVRPLSIPSDTPDETAGDETSGVDGTMMSLSTLPLGTSFTSSPPTSKPTQM